MTPNSYKLLQRCVEEGVMIGVNRAYKHTDNPTAEQLVDAIERAVMNEICEWFKFNEDWNDL